MISKCLITRIKKCQVELKQDHEVEDLRFVGKRSRDSTKNAELPRQRRKSLTRKSPKINDFDEDRTADDLKNF